VKIALTATSSQARFAPILLRGGIESAFALAAELGYDGVELHLRRPGDIDAAAARNLCAQYGLGVPTLGTGMAAGEEGLTFSDPDPDIRHKAVERIREHIALAAYLDSAVTIGLIRGRLGNDSEQRPVHHATVLACLDECCRFAQACGVRIFLEPLNRYEADYLNTVEETLDAMKEIGAPNLKVLADTFHMNIEEIDMAAALRRAGPCLGHVHLVDSNRQAPGYGHVDMRSILQALSGIHYQGYLSFEVLPLPESRQAAGDAIRFTRNALEVILHEPE
jgi:sugar phosphate isomerase/epimerase